MASIAMSLIPLFGPVLMFTTTAGAALWAADIERSACGNAQSGGAGKQEPAGGQDHGDEVHPGQLDYE